MRRITANWTAIAAALEPHQARTLQEYGRAKGLHSEELWQDPACSTVAIALAVENLVATVCTSRRVTERQALVQAAIQFELDIETLLRQRRRFRRRTGPV